MDSQLYCQVAVNFPVGNGILTYEQSQRDLKRGDLVEVPLGRRKAKGCVLTTSIPEDKVQEELSKYELKKNGEILGNSFSLGENELALFQWMANYYHYSLGQLVFDCLPKFLKRPRALKPIQGLNKEINHELTPDQENVWSNLKIRNESSFSKEFIYGVTGSGKTLIYLKQIKETLKKGKSVLFLLPEINLTPQFLETFKEHLPCEILTYHSGVSASEKYNVWKHLYETEEPIFVVGVRSSVFLPVNNLGLIIVDEEHDSSFKQSDRCPYNGRDVAIKKAQLANCPVLMGSATPSIENYFSFKNNFPEKFHEMTKRVSGAFPEVELVNSRDITDFNTPSWPLSLDSIEEIKKALDKKEQVIVFVSRLGFANFIQCSGCGFKFTDPETETNLRFFKNKNILRSAHSEFQMPVPDICPSCGNMNLLQKGYGTEKVEEVLQGVFPDKKVGRFDRDEIKNFNDLNDTLDRFSRGDIDILVGTQMLSKGHNFKRVNLVVVLGIDSQLNFPDFRSVERAYQLLTQVSGRAGRYSKSSKVIVQTLNPESSLFEYFKNPTTNAFFEEELNVRQITGFPPYQKMCALFFTGRSRDQVIEQSIKSKDYLSNLAVANKLDLEVMGPAPVSIEKKAKQYTWNIILRSPVHKDLHLALDAHNKNLRTIKQVSIKVDVDPLYYC